MSFPVGSIPGLLQSGLGATLCPVITLYFSNESTYHSILTCPSHQTKHRQEGWDSWLACSPLHLQFWERTRGILGSQNIRTVKDQLSEWANGWMNEWVIGWMNELLSEWIYNGGNEKFFQRWKRTNNCLKYGEDYFTKKTVLSSFCPRWQS